MYGRESCMKVYHVSEKVKKIYIAIGLFFFAFAVFVLIVRPVPYTKAYLNLVFYVFVIALACLHMTRHKTFQIRVNNSEIYCYNGLLNTKHIPLNMIETIEYAEKGKIQIHTNCWNKNQTYKLLNVLSKNDLTDFLQTVVSEQKNIQLVYLENKSAGKGERKSE